MGFSGDEIKSLRRAALLHDLGKVAVPGSILDKPGKLTDEEFAVIKEHAQLTIDILKEITPFRDLASVAAYHQERYDGSGYPHGLKGEEIPIPSRVLAVADVFDALTSDRAYRKAMNMGEAVGILKKGSGSLFDPEVLAIALNILDTETLSRNLARRRQ
jgi:energy-coupling factor transport system substrate-specific component